MMKLKFKKAGIVVKPHNNVTSHLKRAYETLKELKVEIILEKIAANLLNLKSDIPREKIADYSDIIILIGGDGTFLSVAKQAVENQIPIAGFNLGTLGFLTELNKDLVDTYLHQIFYGKLRISERKLLEIDFKGKKYIALNDVVASKGNISRIIKLLLEINKLRVSEIRADGLIISTPTGSTAYSLSAGGPIVTPDVKGIIVTPICPHSFTFRPIIIPDNSQIKVKLLSDTNGVYLTIDGQEVIPMLVNDIFKVNIYNKKLKIIESIDMNYYKLLSEKLNWGI